MKFSEDILENGFPITAYEPGCIKVRETEHRTSILLMPEQFIGPWEISDIEQLSSEALQELMKYEPEIIIFGTGEFQIFPHPKCFIPLMEKGIGYEVMSTAAACRTYDILLSEDRNVLAALIP